MRAWSDSYSCDEPERVCGCGTVVTGEEGHLSLLSFRSTTDSSVEKKFFFHHSSRTCTSTVRIDYLYEYRYSYVPVLVV